MYLVRFKLDNLEVTVNKVELENNLSRYLIGQWGHFDVVRITVSVLRTFEELDGTKTHHTLTTTVYRGGNERHTYQDFSEDSIGYIRFK